MTGLHKGDSRVFDGNVEQEVLSLTSEDAPLAVGVVFDTSASMDRKALVILSDGGDNRSRYTEREIRQTGSLLRFVDHRFGGLNHHLHGIAYRQVEFFGAGARDDTLDQMVADLYDHAGHNCAQVYLLDHPRQFVTSRQ